MREKLKAPNMTWGSRMEPRRLRAIERHITFPALLADYGCGHGAYVEHFNTAYGERSRCVGMDLFEYPGWDATQKKMSPDAQDLFLVVEDGSVPFPEDHFDISFSFEVLEHCEDPARTLMEIVRVTRKYVMLSVPNCEPHPQLANYGLALGHWVDTTHLNFFTRESICRLVGDCGLTVVNVEGAAALNLSNCFWDNTRLPGYVKRGLKYASNRIGLGLTLHNSILVTADKR